LLFFQFLFSSSFLVLAKLQDALINRIGFQKSTVFLVVFALVFQGVTE
jgi:hypothetical protein